MSDVVVKFDLSDSIKIECWTGKITNYGDYKVMRTVGCSNMYELASKVFEDGWIPFGEIVWITGRGKAKNVFKGNLSQVKDDLERACENELRKNYKTKPLPNDRFIEFKELPQDLLQANDERLKGIEASNVIEVPEILDGVVIGYNKVTIDKSWSEAKKEEYREK